MSLNEYTDIPSGPNQLGIAIKAYASGMAVSISGATINISGAVIEISGESVRAVISGDAVFAYISGGSVVANISGQQVVISGQSIREISATSMRARPGLAITGASGGTVLASGDCKNAVITSQSGNGDMYVGGVQTPDYPYSGNGIRLQANAAISLDITNFNEIAVFATTSGQVINYGGNQF